MLHDREEADGTRSTCYSSFSKKLKIQPLYGKLGCKVSQADEIYSVKQKEAVKHCCVYIIQRRKKNMCRKMCNKTGGYY